MRPSTWRLDDLRSVILNLGYVGENLHTRIIIDCKKMFDQYPNASVSMTVTPPEGEPYPGLIERDGDLVIWDVRDSDLVAEGNGEIQLVFTQEPHIARSYNARTHVCRSQVPTGDVPSGLDDFVTRADQLLDQVEDTFPAGGTTGQVLAKKSDADYDTEWVDQGAGGTSDYDELENRPQIGGVTLTGNKTLHDLGAASEAEVAAKYTKPATGIPASDLAAGVIPDPEDLIDDTAGAGDTDKVWSADKSHALLTEISSRRISTFGVKTVDDGENYNRFISALNGGYRLIIDKDFEISINDEVTTRNVSKPVVLYGEGDHTITITGTISGSYGSLIIPAEGLCDIRLFGVKIANECNKNVTLFNGVDYRLWKMNTVKMEECNICGNIRPLYMRGSFSEAFDNFGIDHLVVRNNTFKDVHDNCFYLNSVRVDTTEISGNTITNMGGTFFYLEISASYYDREGMKKSRKVVNVDGNRVCNNMAYWYTGNSTYFAFVYVQCETLNYTNNRVEGLKTETTAATYDVYGAANKLLYLNNEWINIVAFNHSALNTLIKGKSGRDEIYKDSLFRVDEGFITNCGKRLEDTDITLMHFEHTDGNVEIANCEIELPIAHHTIQHSTWYYKTLNFHNNHIHIGRWYNYNILNVPATCRTLNFNDNTIVIDDFSGGMGLINGYGFGRYLVEFNRNDISIANGNFSTPFVTNLTGERFVMKDNNIQLTTKEAEEGENQRIWYGIYTCDFKRAEISGNTFNCNACEYMRFVYIDELDRFSGRFKGTEITGNKSQRLFINTDYSIFDRTYYFTATAYANDGIERYRTIARIYVEDDVLKLKYINNEGNFTTATITTPGTRTLKNLDAGTNYAITQTTLSDGTAYFKLTAGNSIKEKNREIEIEITCVDNMKESGMDVEGLIYSQKIPSWATEVMIRQIGGKTIVLNQMVEKQTYQTTHVTADGTGKIVINGTFQSVDFAIISRDISFPTYNGHVYYITGNTNSNIRLCTTAATDGSYGDIGEGRIYTNDKADNANTKMQVRLSAGTYDNVVLYPQMYDLTVMFGAGNEPTTVEEIRKILPNIYYDYNSGTVINALVDRIDFSSKNLINPELCGTDTNGVYVIVPVQKNTQYIISSDYIVEQFYIVSDAVREYDSNNTLLNTITLTYDVDGKPNAFIVGRETEYVKFYIEGDGVQDESAFRGLNIMMEEGNASTKYAEYEQPFSVDLPEEVLQLDSYGIGTGLSLRNYIDFDTKTYHKYCELDGTTVVPVSHTTTDVSELLDGFVRNIDPMGCKKITFHSDSVENETYISVPVKMKYVR